MVRADKQLTIRMPDKGTKERIIKKLRLACAIRGLKQAAMIEELLQELIDEHYDR